MALPSNVSFGTVVGRFMRAVADGADPDLDPDGIPMSGLTVKFIPSVDRFKNTTATPPVTIVADPVTVTTDSDGFVVGFDSAPGVRLLATDDEDLNPTGWTWGVAISGPGFKTITFNFALPSDGVVDLATVVPVPGNPGQAMQDWLAAVEATQSAASVAEGAAVQAVSAASDAAVHASEVLAVPATNDGIMTTVAADPNSEFAAQQRNTFGVHLTAPESGSALSMIQAAVDNANGLPVVLRAGDYILDGSITGSACQVILSAGARLLITTNTPAFEISGAGSGSSRAIQADVSSGDTIVQANSVGMAVGDYVLMRGSAIWPGPKGTKRGEIQRVRQIDGTTQFRTDGLIDFDYSVAGGDSVVVFGMARGVSITGPGEVVNTIGAALKVPAIRLTACAAPRLDVTIRNAGGPGVTLSGCVDVDVNARVYDSLDDESNGNFGYGVEAFGATRGGRVRVDHHKGRHAFTTNGGATGTGVPAHMVVTGYAQGLTDTAWDTHEEGYDITFLDVVAVGCRNGGIKHRAPQSSVINPIVRNTRGVGIRFSPDSVGGSLAGGSIKGLRYLSPGSPGVGVQIEADDVTISGNPVIECDDQGVLVFEGADNSTIMDGLYRSGARGEAGTDRGIEYRGTSSGHMVGAGVRIVASSDLVLDSGVSISDARPQRVRVDFDVLTSSVSNVNFDNVQNSSSAWWNTRRLSSGAQNDELVLVEYLAAGSWTFDLFHDTSTTRGIYTVAVAPIRGGEIGTYSDIGTVDGYAAAGERVRSNISGVSIPRSGRWAVRIRMATKNASSSSYHGSMSKLSAVRQS